MSDQDSQVAADLGQLGQMIYGLMASQAIYAAAKLAIPDLIGAEPKTIGELADVTKAHADSLQRLLRMLTSIGIFAEDAGGKFKQTRLSEFLRSDHPRSARGLALLVGAPFFWQSWGELHAAVMDGKSAFERVFGAPLFNYFLEHPDEAAIGIAGMTSGSSMDAPAVVAAYDFSKFDLIVDVGGGQGGMLQAILLANSELRGVLADQPSVVAGATALRTGIVANRCSIEAVDFFNSVPDGADAYIMKWILHDWNDEDCLRILGCCRRAIRPDGKLLVVDAVLKPSNEPDAGKFMDVNMLVFAHGGRERTEAEFAELLRRAGFILERVIPTATSLSIVEGRPV